MFFFLQNSSLLFSITGSSSFSVIHVSVNIKNNFEKDTTLLLFFISWSLGGHAISFQINPWVAFGCHTGWLFILHWYACGADGLSGGRSVYGHLITKFSRMGSLPHLLTHGAHQPASRARAPLWTPRWTLYSKRLPIYDALVGSPGRQSFGWSWGFVHRAPFNTFGLFTRNFDWVVF